MIIISDTFFSNTVEHISIFLAGSTAIGIVAHAVDSFPTPTNKYGQWFLGIIKYLVGQRKSALNAMQGNDTAIMAVPKGSLTNSPAAVILTPDTKKD